jgi:hypothetical protein
MGPDERLRAVLLAGLAGLALVIGAWWWQGAAPALGPTGPSPSPSTAAFLQPGVRVADPTTGQLFDGSSPGPAGQVVIHQEPGPAPARAAVVQELWHERSWLVPGGRPLVRRATASVATHYLLNVRCVGPGAVVVEISGARYDPPPRTVRCGQAAETDVVQAAAGRLLVRFSAVEGALELDARLSALS